MKKDLTHLRASLKLCWEGLKSKGLFVSFKDYETWEKRNEKPKKKK